MSNTDMWITDYQLVGIANERAISSDSVVPVTSQPFNQLLRNENIFVKLILRTKKYHAAWNTGQLTVGSDGYYIQQGFPKS